MALQFSYTAPFTTCFEQAYCRVVKIDLDQDAQRGAVEYWVYPCAAVRQADHAATVQRVILPVYETEDAPDYSTYFGSTALSADGMNPIKAAYAFLKTRSDFAGAVDIL
jgi:hypothetical protein